MNNKGTASRLVLGHFKDNIYVEVDHLDPESK